MLYAILILIIINIAFNYWIGSVLHNMIQGLYRREEDNAITTTPIQGSHPTQ